MLIKEYHRYLCSIEDYFRHADRTVVADIIDDKSCEVLKMEKAKEADREKCPDPQTSTDNLMTGNQVLSRLVALPNFESINGDDRVAVCEFFDSLQTAHNAAADVAGHLTTLGRMLDPQQFQFILKHSLCLLVQLQVPAGLCHPGEPQFAKPNLSSDELFEQQVVNNILPRPYHPKLETVAPKHPTRALPTAIHYQLRKWLFMKFTASQTEIADMFQVECKKFFTTITGHQYDAGKKPTKVDKLRMLGSKTDAELEKSEEPTQETEQTQAKPTETIDPDMPALEDVAKQSPWQIFKYKQPTDRPP